MRASPTHRQRGRPLHSAPGAAGWVAGPVMALLLFASPAQSEPVASAAHSEPAASSARRAVEGSIERTRAILRHDTLGRAQKLARLGAEADAVTDWRRIARSCAQTQWPQLTKRQRTRFEEAFVTVLRSSHVLTVYNLDPDRRFELAVGGSTAAGVWIDLRANDARLFDMTLGFLVNRQGRVVDARLGPYVLTDLLRELIDRFVRVHGVQSLLTRLEARAATEKRRVSDFINDLADPDASRGSGSR